MDTTQIYGNEAAVGAAIKASGIPRDEIFLTTKVWTTEVGKDDFLPSVEKSLKKLAVDHVDLLLLHWPRLSETTSSAEQIEEPNKTVAKGMSRHIDFSRICIEKLTRANALGD